MAKQRKSRASVRYESPSHLTLSSFETPFEQSLNPQNRWVLLAGLIPWDAFNEGTHLDSYIEQYRKRFGYYPEEVLVDQIYCTRSNRKMLKEKGIRLLAKPLGRPSSAVSIHVSPGERNPIEGKFGQAKTGYGLNRIKARLRQTSETWIAGIFLVLNLVKLAGAALPCPIIKWWLSFSTDPILSDHKLSLNLSLNKIRNAHNQSIMSVSCTRSGT